eukprot:sb/3462856/
MRLQFTASKCKPLIFTMTPFYLTLLLLLLSPAALAATQCSEGQEKCSGYAAFDDSTEGRVQPEGLFSNEESEVTEAQLKLVDGKVPGWLAGTMYKVGVGAYSVGERKVNNVVDALSKVYKWTFTPGNEPSFSAKFLKTGIFNRSVETGELVPHKIVGDMDPPVSTFEKAKMTVWDSRRDNNNITPWKLKGRDGITVCGEAPLYFDVHPDTLDHMDKYTLVSQPWFVKEFMSASHFTRHPSTGDSYNYIYVTGLDKGMVSGVEPHFQMVRFTTDITGKAATEVVGTIPSPLDDMRIIHSMGVTEDYVILPRLSLRVKLESPFHVCTNIVFDKEAPTQIHVMSLKDGTYRTFMFDPFISVHIINSFQRKNEKGEVEIVVDYPTPTSMKAFDDTHCYYEILNKDYILDDNFVYRKEFQPLTDITIRRFVMNMETGESEVRDHPQMWSPRVLHVDFPYINDKHRGKPFCIVYLHTIQWDNKNAMGLLKLNLCRQESSNWDDLNLFPVEPVFVGRPGGRKEDDGVLMAPVFNAITQDSELYIWDAESMKVIARLSSPIRIPWTNHGMWVDADMCSRRSHWVGGWETSRGSEIGVVSWVTQYKDDVVIRCPDRGGMDNGGTPGAECKDFSKRPATQSQLLSFDLPWKQINNQSELVI